MFLILKTTDWKEEDYVKNNIVPFGWVEDNNRLISNNTEIVAKVQTEEQRNFLLEKLNNKYIRHLRGGSIFEKEAEKRITEQFGTSGEYVTRQRIWQDGAEFGYNKSNEWHYVKDGDLPKDEDWKWCMSYRGYYYVAKYEEMFGCWTNQEYSEVMQPYAWKEIVPPKEIGINYD